MNHRRGRRLVAGITGAALLVPGALLAGATPAAAASVMVTDCESWPQETFYRNQPVCVTGDLDYVPPGYFIPTADIYVVANTGWQSGQSATDVTGAVNRFQSFGTFYDEFAWLPDLSPGRYDILIDNDLNGRWDPAHDILLGSGSDFAFDVLGTDLAGYDLDVAAIKSEAGSQVAKWRFLGAGSDVYTVGDATRSGVRASRVPQKAAWKVGTFIAAGAYKLSDLAVETSYNGYVVDVGLEIIGSLAGTQATHFQALADDPADPHYGIPVGLDLSLVNTGLADALTSSGLTAAYPFSARTGDPMEARQVQIATLSAEQAALVRAVMQSNERYLGAQEADDVRWAVSHARSMSYYADALLATQQELVDLLQDQRDEIALLPGATDTIDASALADLQARVNSTGLTPAEVTDLEALGMGPADLADVIENVTEIDAPSADFSILDTYDDVLAGAASYESELSDLADQAGDLVTSLTTDVESVATPSIIVTTPTLPVAAGAAASLSASVTGGTGSLTVRWDLDLDGAFDDATGTSASITLPKAQGQLVGARVTDARGLSRTSYTRITSVAANLQPVIATSTPGLGHVTITGGSSQTFTVAATDPESDALTYTWFVDESTVPVATGTSYTRSTTLGERSLHAIRVVVDDGQSTHHQVEARWALSTVP